jgi:Uma2 family endonuclease
MVGIRQTTLEVESEVFESEIFYPEEIKMPQGEKHDDIRIKLCEFIGVIFDDIANRHSGGDCFFYYEEGYRDKVFAPDVYVLATANKSFRKSYKFWEEKIDLRFVCEIWSDANKEVERLQKFAFYQNVLKVPEYVELTTDDKFYAYRLESNAYVMIEPNDKGRYALRELGAELTFEDGLIRVYQNGKRIPTLQEALMPKIKTAAKDGRSKKNPR